MGLIPPGLKNRDPGALPYSGVLSTSERETRAGAMGGVKLAGKGAGNHAESKK